MMVELQGFGTICPELFEALPWVLSYVSSHLSYDGGVVIIHPAGEGAEAQRGEAACGRSHSL